MHNVNMELHLREKLHSFSNTAGWLKSSWLSKMILLNLASQKKNYLQVQLKITVLWIPISRYWSYFIKGGTVQPRQVGIWSPPTPKNSVSSLWLCTNLLSTRCSVNATPQQIPQAAKVVEKFVKDIARSKKERKPVRPYVVEVKGRLSLLH